MLLSKDEPHTRVVAFDLAGRVRPPADVRWPSDSGGLNVTARRPRRRGYSHLRTALDRQIGVGLAILVLAARGESPASHRDRRCARLARRDEGAYRQYSTPGGNGSTLAASGCSADRMQRDFHHGLLGSVAARPCQVRVRTGRTGRARLLARIGLRARARITTRFRPPFHPAMVGAGLCLAGVEYRLYAPSSRLAMTERGMSTTPEKGRVFLLGPLGC